LRNETYDLVRQHGLTGVGLKYLFPPHNLILAVLGAMGVVGLAGFVVVCIDLIRRLLTSRAGDTILVAVLASTLAMYACAWVVNFGWEHFLWLPVALVLGDVRPAASVMPAGRGTLDGELRPRQVRVS